MIASKQRNENVMRFGRDEFSANLVPRITSLFHQEHPFASTGDGNRRGTASRTAANNHEIVTYFHAIAPMRKR